MPGMRVLGIDPGSETTGWGMIEGDGPRYHLLEYGAIRLPASQRFSARLLTICSALEEIISRHSPEACAIEDGFLATNVKVTLKLGQVRGVAMLAAERAGLASIKPSLVGLEDGLAVCLFASCGPALLQGACLCTVFTQCREPPTS